MVESRLGTDGTRTVARQRRLVEMKESSFCCVGIGGGEVEDGLERSNAQILSKGKCGGAIRRRLIDVQPGPTSVLPLASKGMRWRQHAASCESWCVRFSWPKHRRDVALEQVNEVGGNSADCKFTGIMAPKRDQQKSAHRRTSVGDVETKGGCDGPWGGHAAGNRCASHLGATD